MQKLKRPLAGILLLFLILSSFPLDAQVRTQSRGRIASGKPKLVVFLIVDQFRYDYLERFDDLFGRDGFRRLVRDGANFSNANFLYVPTYTAPGHAAIATGSVPAQNGIIGNTWYDRQAGRVRVMVSDPDARYVTMKGVDERLGSVSPRTMIGTTLADQMRLATNFRGKVVAVSQKDRSAILPAGHKPNGAFWYSTLDGTFVTSDYYFKDLPAWVKNFNTSNRPDKYYGRKWERSLTESAYSRAQKENLAIQRSSLGNRFPYVLATDESKPGTKFYSAFEVTPFASEHLADFARAAVEGEDLGTDEFTDLLSVSFSSPDLIGHAYGPDSQEVEDAFVRLDRVVADLLAYLDRKVGLQNTVIAVTGDHGVSPVPEYMKSLGYDAGRLSPGEAIAAVNKALSSRYGQEEKWVQALVNEQFYLDPQLAAKYKADPSEVERIAGEAAMTVPGIINYFTRTELTSGCLPATPIARRIANGFNRQRSGDVWVVTKPFSFFAEGGLATTHGSPYHYDTHVPVIFFGRGITRGRSSIEASPSDIAPTIASLLGIEMPTSVVGRVLPLQGSGGEGKE